MADAPLILESDYLDQAYVKMNKGIENANEALSAANEPIDAPKTTFINSKNMYLVEGAFKTGALKSSTIGDKLEYLPGTHYISNPIIIENHQQVIFYAEGKYPVITFADKLKNIIYVYYAPDLYGHTVDIPTNAYYMVFALDSYVSNAFISFDNDVKPEYLTTIYHDLVKASKLDIIEADFDEFENYQHRNTGAYNFVANPEAKVYVSKYKKGDHITYSTGGYANVILFDSKGKLLEDKGWLQAGSFNFTDEGFFSLTTTYPIPSSFSLRKSTNTFNLKEYSFNHRELNEFIEQTSGSFLDGETVVFDGDSITRGEGVSENFIGIGPHDNKGWGYSIQELFPKSNCYGYAQSGWRVGRYSENDTQSLLDHIPEYPEHVDCFVLSGGFNDQAQQLALGQIQKGYYNATYDEYTFTGAIESWFKQIRQRYPLAKIVYVITPKRMYKGYEADPPTDWINPHTDSKGENVDHLYAYKTERCAVFFQRIKEVCKKWAINYIDLSSVAGVVGTGEIVSEGLDINRYFYQIDSATGEADYTHPNKLLYDTHLVPLIVSKLREMYG